MSSTDDIDAMAEKTVDDTMIDNRPEGSNDLVCLVCGCRVAIARHAIELFAAKEQDGLAASRCDALGPIVIKLREIADNLAPAGAGSPDDTKACTRVTSAGATPGESDREEEIEHCGYPVTECIMYDEARKVGFAAGRAAGEKKVYREVVEFIEVQSLLPQDKLAVALDNLRHRFDRLGGEGETKT